MSFRTVYGYKYSENGWRMCNRDECVVANVLPYTNTAPVRSGDAATILNAWLLWYHRNVEPISSPVWGWSATNDVANSNHLSGTALDINAPKYPWGARVMPLNQIEKVRKGLALFEGTIFWGADWQRADEMHYQLGFAEGDRRISAFAEKLNNGHLGIYGTAEPSEEGALMALSHAEQVELLTKTRELHHFLVTAEPSMVDGTPFAAATLIRTADYHAFNAHSLAKRIAKKLGVIE